jgi:hypothetical protein
VSEWSSEEHELGLAAFVAARRRARFRASVSSSKARARLRRQLGHFRDFDERFQIEVPALAADAERRWILKTLADGGAPNTCHLLSEDSALDGQSLDLTEAINTVSARGIGTLISCIPGRLGYFEGENPRDRCVLRRRP